MFNENYIIIEQGLKEDDEVYLSVPENSEKFKLSGKELIPVLKERERLKKEKEEREQDTVRRNNGKQNRPNGKRRKPSSGSNS